MSELEDKIKQILEESKALEEESLVSSVEVKKASEIFGDKAQDPEKSMVIVTCENGARTNLSLPNGLSWNGENWEILNEEELKASMRFPQLKMRKFVEQYGSLPKKGLKVNTYSDNQGFLRIEVR